MLAKRPWPRRPARPRPAGWEHVMRLTLMRWLEQTASQMAEARLICQPGVSALLNPRLPTSPIHNIVAFSDALAVEAALDALATEYHRTGISGWSVIVLPNDDDVVALLRRRGYALRGSPEAMVCELAGLPEPGRGLYVEVDPGGSISAEVQARAYYWPVAGFRDLFGAITDRMRTYVAWCGGRPACTLQIVEEGRDAGLFGMATDPVFQRQGLARQLVLHALHEAKERNMISSTLQASPAGQPVYTGVGYRSIGRAGLWEAPRFPPPARTVGSAVKRVTRAVGRARLDRTFR